MARTTSSPAPWAPMPKLLRKLYATCRSTSRASAFVMLFCGFAASIWILVCSSAAHQSDSALTISIWPLNARALGTTLLTEQQSQNIDLWNINVSMMRSVYRHVVTKCSLAELCVDSTRDMAATQETTFQPLKEVYDEGGTLLLVSIGLLRKPGVESRLCLA